MDQALHSWDDIDRMYAVKKKEEVFSSALKISSMHWYNESIKLRTKVQRKAKYNEQKQHRQHKYQPNKNK